MKLECHCLPALPPLAWLCELRHGQETACLLHGRDVEFGESFFHDGAWCGPFAEGGFADLPNFGSGARTDARGITFHPPDHVLEGLFLITEETDEGRRLCISNSLAFLLARTGNEIDRSRIDYLPLFARSLAGIGQHSLPLPIAGGKTVTHHFYHALRIAPDLIPHTVIKHRHEDFHDYESFIAMYRRHAKALFANAADPARKRCYRPLSTLSTGYDSTALTAIVAPVGCRRAFSFGESRPRGGVVEHDGGEEIGRAMGIEVIMLDRLAYRAADDMPELETMGVGNEMSSARHLLRGSVFLSGYFSGALWDIHFADINDELRAADGGHTMGEMRLHNGYVHAPFGFVAGRQLQQLNEIGLSEDMKPWRLFTDYDRPISRRVVEEAGVPRTAFGQKKKAAGVFYRFEGLRETMAPRSYADYMAFHEAHAPGTGALARRLNALRYRLWDLNHRAQEKLMRITHKKWPFRVRIPLLFPQVPRISEASLLFPWAVSRMTERYRAHLAGSGLLPAGKRASMAACPGQERKPHVASVSDRSLLLAHTERLEDFHCT